MTPSRRPRQPPRGQTGDPNTIINGSSSSAFPPPKTHINTERGSVCRQKGQRRPRCHRPAGKVTSRESDAHVCCQGRRRGVQAPASAKRTASPKAPPSPHMKWVQRECQLSEAGLRSKWLPTACLIPGPNRAPEPGPWSRPKWQEAWAGERGVLSHALASWRSPLATLHRRRAAPLARTSAGPTC